MQWELLLQLLDPPHRRLAARHRDLLLGLGQTVQVGADHGPRRAGRGPVQPQLGV